MSIFDELENGGSVKESKPKKVKSKTKNPILKESKALLLYTLSTVVLLFAILTLFINSDSDFNAVGLYEKHTAIEDSIKATENNIGEITQTRSKISFVQGEVQERVKQLQDANIVRTDLEESHYFTAYFDTLITKHKIHLHSISVLEPDMSNVPENVEVEVPVKPLHIIMEGASQDVINLFKDLYTKSITYDENLVFTNLYDNHVRVEFDITFKKGGDN